ncbi:DUF4271 domain-containing protein [Tannerella sp.]|uniref:DUF4271 domain-containing protein n=1 Tax=Tannerella sp. TaxID=2382127 RepID=UPI0026DD7FE5|nr:DUF4271 domain-containing protein [Tannerella sp.]MDO4703051.1 DUF4271 domain-containing protein [Tannerella sp.]
MENELFEGYIGVGFDYGRHIHDILFVMMLVLISIFSVIFRIFYPLIRKMIRSLLSVRERQNLFETSMKKNLFFKAFMKFQMLFLCTIFFYLLILRGGYVQLNDFGPALLLMGSLLVAVYAYYLIKQGIYALYGQVFSKEEKYSLWRNGYHSLSYIWGTLLYFPTFWLLFDRQHTPYILMLYLALYVLYRIVFAYTTIRIFYNKNTGFLFLSSYLCAQEIIPLLFVYEGLNYLHNNIDTSTLWH